MNLAIRFDDVRDAAQRLAGVAQRTPVLRSRSADERSGAQLFFKCENLQRMGAFKFRGAYNALSQFTPEQRSGERGGGGRIAGGGVLCGTTGGSCDISRDADRLFHAA